jgi:hypothetical protein
MPRKSSSASRKKQFRPISLDVLNFLLSDVRGALGPFLNVFLVTQQHWSQSSAHNAGVEGSSPSLSTNLINPGRSLVREAVGREPWCEILGRIRRLIAQPCAICW